MLYDEKKRKIKVMKDKIEYEIVYILRKKKRNERKIFLLFV